MPSDPLSNLPVTSTVTRRGALGRLGALLAIGAWPGALAAKSACCATKPGRIRFVVTNDYHHEEPACDPWMEALFAQIAATEGADFCFGLGDLANSGKRASLEKIADLAGTLPMPFYPTPGNHDLDESPVDGFYAEIFPGRRNYTFTQNGWQFVVVDSSEGTKWHGMTIADDTLAWLDETMPTLDPTAPTVLATHFPMMPTLLDSGSPEHGVVDLCPVNAEDLLARFVGYNLRGSFSGHFHGQTVNTRGVAELVTNVCVARVRSNHDGTDFKGYWVCDGEPDGTLTRTFVPWAGI